uniref:Uncharacterized protein n=1 Tax=uncultured prokaryote TaxID=198431 RepID=A0A0H5Q3V3_9ZZZZ|nr:hypothetical protein [uncultured prokaryote]
MSDYRGIVKHVSYWRGIVHRWSTSYSLTAAGSPVIDTAACEILLSNDDLMCFGQSAADGGTYECAIYNAGGGTPLATYTAFDYETPSTWILHAGAATWDVAETINSDTGLESALVVDWPAGVSKSGKPVAFRKWFHAVPQSGTAPKTPDVPAASLTKLQAQAAALQVCLTSGYGLNLGNAGRVAGSPVVSAYYGNHQMPRGRRRKKVTLSTPNGKISLSDLVDIAGE